MATRWRYAHPFDLHYLLPHGDKSRQLPKSPSTTASRISRSKLVCKSKEDKEQWKLELSDFNPAKWFDVPEAAIAELMEQEKSKTEEDGWGGSDWDEDWRIEEDSKETVSNSFFPMAQNRDKPKSGRDTWLKPESDVQSFFDLVDFNEREAESQIVMDWGRNQEESRSAIKFSGEIRVEQADIELHIKGGVMKPLNEDEMFERLSLKANELNAGYVSHNKNGLLDAISDSISALVLLILLLTSNEGVQNLLSTSNRFFRGLSDTAKAFLIILIADILLGYHSEEGWTAVIRMVGSRYGDTPEEGPVTVIVAILPVFLDTCFKYWIFRGLNRRSPAAGVTLKTMNRH